MLHQRIQAETADPFPGDDDANQAVLDQRRRVADYADATKRLATFQFRRPEDKEAFRRDVIQMRDDIVSRATSAGIVEHQMEAFWDAVQTAAAAKFGKRIDIYPIASRNSAPPPAIAAPQVPPAGIAKLRKLRSKRA